MNSPPAPFPVSEFVAMNRKLHEIVHVFISCLCFVDFVLLEL